MDFLPHTCRICLDQDDTGINLFCDEQTSKLILEKIYLCFQITLNYEDHLPNSICRKCIKDLNCADNFRVNCVTFEKRFNCINQEIIIPTETVKYLDDTDDVQPRKEAKETEKSPLRTSENYKNRNTKFHCKTCNKFLKSETSLSKHVVSMHQNRKHVGRMTGHGASRRYHCTKCSYSSIYSQTLVNHMRRHSGDKPYHCHCGKSFTQTASLATHQKTHSDVMSHICSTCGKQFRHAFSLTNHLLVHKSEQFHCKICQKKLKTESSLADHMNRHYNIRNYSCEKCGDTFVTSSDLTNHRKRHSSEKKAECHLCGYKTRAKTNLMVHLKRHVGDKSFECDICNKAVYTQSELRRHMRVHSREKPYHCPSCPQRFSQPGSLNLHVRNLHGIVDYRWGRGRTLSKTTSTFKQEK